MNRSTVNVSFFTDATGRDLAEVALAHRKQPAIVTAADWLRLDVAGLSGFWFENRVRNYRYVRAISRRTGNLESIARFIVGADRGQIVHSKDGNHLNLRPENLILRKGWSKMACTREAIEAAQAETRTDEADELIPILSEAATDKPHGF